MQEMIQKYLAWNSLEVNENANRYPSPTGFFSYLLEEHMPVDLPAKVAEAHQEGLIYVHKLPYSAYLPYCSGHSISRLLKQGLVTPIIASRPARHLDTFVDHVANFLSTAQHYFTGAQAFSSVEWYAGPFIRNDKLDFKAVKQSVQRLVYNLNYPSRVGFQTPFTNFTVTMNAPRKMLDGDRAVYDGKEVEPLGVYEEEAKLFLKALTSVLKEGDAEGKPFTFPIPTLMTTATWLWEDPEIFEAVFTTAAKRGSFYWLNTRVVDPDGSFAMCCRINIDRNELMYAKGARISLKRDVKLATEDLWSRMEKQRFGGVWALPDVTGSVGVIDVNLPRIALDARGDDGRFWELYGERLELVKRGLDWLRERYVKLLKTEMYSFVRRYLPEFPTSHFNTIGIIGLPEAAAIYMGKPDLWTEGSHRDWAAAADLMKKMVSFAVEKAREWMSEEGTPWNVEEVPGESAAAKLAIKDARRYPELAQYLPDLIYSTSVAPYYAPMELWERVEVEAKVQREFTGGVMMHIFLGEEPDPEALAKLARRITETEVVYWSFTPAQTHCPRCGRTYTGLYKRCPSCGYEGVEVWSRIIGYYRPLKNWNPYRRREFWLRRHY
ncbi:anaerobic ribonucleoside triphosphate reductase [Pyrobaculum neutrophilum]|uniref:Anaerobic ribonucleoside-triphosphate reductase n=1 Tax=Pyrobaculum neutrophilum (strain DSM 2338 / JCM 9278 / NBRC 100436 / V24Sta) TaxID=444157 RepID=B1YBU3_PYRNV|nr:anaerobic ribonucleoside triphosphate reductase [Pyrobaculum neutrophilum]ACB39327.1 anaerobic ribonucleoside-triphosphate reductase [Pyrobaculum neutrophilum V24Sta]